MFGLIVLAGLGGAAGLLTGAASAPARGTSEASWDKYKVLGTRNIFLRDRSRPAPPRAAGKDDKLAPAEADSGLVLTGTAQSGSIWVAVLEDLRGGTPVQAVAGEIIEGGRVVEVAMDGIVYERRGSLRRIAVGQNLSGQAVAEWSGSPATSQPATQPASGDGGTGGLSDIERRMRERRARE